MIKPLSRRAAELPRAARASLEGRMLLTLRRALLGRALAWFGAALLAWSLGNAAFLLLGASARAAPILAFALASALPAFLAWPTRGAALVAALRAADEAAAIESWLEAPPGPARELLAARVAERCAAMALERRPPQPRAAPGLGKLYLYALCAFAAFQIAALVLVGRPLAGYAGPDSVEAGRRLDESVFGAPGEADPAALRRSRDRQAEAEAGSAPRLGSADAEANSDAEAFGMKLGAAKEALLEGSGLDAATRDPEAPAGGGQSRVAVPDPAGPGGKDAAGRDAGHAERNEIPGSAGRPTGWESASESLAPSPLVDYRARFSKVLAERTREEIEATNELSLGELRAYERRYFASFHLASGIAPREEAYAAALKRRWRELGGGK